MENSVRVRLNETFTLYLRNNGNRMYVHEFEHEEIFGYSFPDRAENNKFMEDIHYRFSDFPNFDFPYTVRHFVGHTGGKCGEYLLNIKSHWDYRYR